MYKVIENIVTWGWGFFFSNLNKSAKLISFEINLVCSLLTGISTMKEQIKLVDEKDQCTPTTHKACRNFCAESTMYRLHSLTVCVTSQLSQIMERNNPTIISEQSENPPECSNHISEQRHHCEDVSLQSNRCITVPLYKNSCGEHTL